MKIKHFFKTNILKHFLVITIFIITSLIFFHPVLSGKKILQNDIIQYTGMSKELKDFRSENGYDAYWTNNSFSGMPTYQLGAKFPHNYIKKLDLSLRFLPRPCSYKMKFRFDKIKKIDNLIYHYLQQEIDFQL